MKNLILLFFFTFALTNIDLAQEKQKAEKAMRCDQMLARIDSVINAINSQPAEKKAIVVVYSGKGDKTRTYNQRRLRAIKKYFVEDHRISEEKLVLTEGGNRNGLAKIEFYLNGELYDEIYSLVKSSVCTSCCGP